MDSLPAWKTTWRYVAGIAVLAFLGYFAFVRGEQVPLLAAADLGFHELGHMLFAWTGEVPAAFAGSATQVALPLAFAAYFLGVRRDVFAGALMLGWAGTSAQNVSVYIADAPYEYLPLIGGYHDWAFLLAVWNATGSAAAIAKTVWAGGLVLLLAGFGACAAALVLRGSEVRRAAQERERLSTLPVREPRSIPPRDPSPVLPSDGQEVGLGD